MTYLFHCNNYDFTHYNLCLAPALTLTTTFHALSVASFVGAEHYMTLTCCHLELHPVLMILSDTVSHSNTLVITF